MTHHGLTRSPMAEEGVPVFPIMLRVPITGAAWAVLAVLHLTLPAAASGGDLTFFPEIDWSEGSIEVRAATQTNQNTQNGKGSRSQGTVLQESINLTADGHVYHPRFMLFHTRLWGGLTEQSGTGGTGSDNRSTATTANYELRTIILPEHPYNLELFTLHEESFAPTSFLRSQSGTFDEQGANFNYKNNPYFFHSGYVATTSESGMNRTDSKTYRLNGSYAGSVLSDTAAYSHTDSASSSGLHATREEYTFGNTSRYAGMVLNSHINNSSTDQQKPLSPDFQTETFSWTEQLTAVLPWNFSTGVNFGYVNATNWMGVGPSTPEKKEFNRSTSTSLNISHHLYQSLMTNYSLNDVAMESSSGEIATRSESLGSIYTKALPFGRLTAGVSFMNAESERTGTLSIINEAHKAALLGTFSLSLRNILESTIVVQVKDPATGSLLLLPQSGYLVARLGDSTQITIFSVAPLTPQPDPLYVYEFQVSYSLSDQAKTALHSRGYSVKLDLIDNLLSVYFNYSTANQEVLSGSLAGGTGRDTSETTGMTVQSGPYVGLIEHQQFRSWQNPSESWKTTGQYRAPIAEDANATAQFSYTLTDYFATPSAPSRADQREKRLGIDITADKRFPHRDLYLFLGTSYTRSRSYVDVDTLSVNSYLMWQVGLLSVNGGAQVSHNESETVGNRVTLVSQYYYITVSRKLF